MDKMRNSASSPWFQMYKTMPIEWREVINSWRSIFTGILPAVRKALSEYLSFIKLSLLKGLRVELVLKIDWEWNKHFVLNTVDVSMSYN